MTASDQNLEAKKNQLEDLRVRVRQSFDDYRRSGIALMATVIALSSGGLAALLHNEPTRPLAFLYLIPIALSILQQLAHYFGSKAKSHSHLNKLYLMIIQEREAYLDAHIGENVFRMHSDLHFGMSDIFCWLACLSLGLVTLWPLFVLAPRSVAFVVLASCVLSLGYWFVRWLMLLWRIGRIVW